ncbi:hypothetical protein LX32DRAFT_337445 [Colletotrichum zoysiae]|uniref:Uncharacterized protein n=1 Tax=Colletotrichum zoysiae TaxID=1216348 RepID=A0AAD9HJ16_9PEZI|nr:hypothetical protein LX32DRAFT_337445 [Colletotrichum zoysiae]
MAAEDLAKFRQCLSVELDHLKLMIHTSVLSAMTGSGHSHRLLDAGSRGSEMLMISPRPMQGLHRHGSWNRGGVDRTLMLRRVETITDLVYERLLIRGGISVEMQGRVYTLPEQVMTSHDEAHLSTVAQLQPLPPTAIHASTFAGDTQPTLENTAKVQSGRVSASSAVGGINEYLRSLNLVELSEEETGYVEDADPTSRLPLPGTEVPDSEREPHNPKDRASSGSQPRAENRTSKVSSFVPDAFESLGLAVSVLQMVTLAVELSSRSSRIYYGARKALVEFGRLSRLLHQYSTLLHAAFEVIRSSMPAGELQNLGWQIIGDSQSTARDIEVFLSRVENPGSAVRAIRGIATFLLRKQEIKDLMERLETLKTTLSVMLQIHQVQMMHMAISSGRSSHGLARSAVHAST